MLPQPDAAIDELTVFQMAKRRSGTSAILLAALACIAVSGRPCGAEPTVSDPLIEPKADCPSGFVPVDKPGFLKLAGCLASSHGLPAEVAHAVIEIESNFKPWALGGDGEVGLMQVLPSTARLMGFRGTNDDLAKSETNITYGVRYLSQAWKLAERDLCTAVMKYRAGHAETRFSHLSVQYCLRARAILKRGGIEVVGQVPKATFGFTNAGLASGGSKGGTCLRRNFVPGPGYGRCLSASSKLSQAKVVSLRRSIFGR